ncbi:MAG: peptide-methionine (R)-S-oxide reductase [Candidatus Ryanbacteria bacterium RIFCSPHIGHO2_02_FULL_45_13b]|uniref:peptide-methionine (R)-S-oxide reductase n=1 Tax=Candidatus Ryanbacteria bacterium RIFCSPHIGHO2_02_FULL_45_13b TaxID=1802117 RepID=A0A1G2G8U5_9BACT|nr:MAG: peptide-methionine (R)-S-oxide reductase [Candidatus Ryanbacteria bacterium RIFCSPHIGHO2_02_FULL_45_13b]
MKPMEKSNEEWKKELPADVYRVTREKGTEAPFTGAYYALKEKGMYRCSNCGAELFSSDAKYDSGSGWPSFTVPVDVRVIETTPDASHGMRRMEISCARCGAHLGHVFDDGPQPEGKRFCVNSASLDFKKKEEK